MQALSSAKQPSLHIIARLIITISANISALALSDPTALLAAWGITALYALHSVRLKTLLKTYLFLAVMCLFYLIFVYFIGKIPAFSRMFAFNFLNLFRPFARIYISMSAAAALAFGAPIQEVMASLQNLKLPAFIFIPVSVAVRFIPAFFDDAKQIRDVCYLRSGGKSLFRQALNPVRFWRGFCLPLIFRALHSSDDLALAAEMKGVGSKGGLKTMPRQRMRAKDFIFLALALGAVTGLVYLQSQAVPAPRGMTHGR